MKPSGVAKLETLLFGRALAVALARDIKSRTSHVTVVLFSVPSMATGSSQHRGETLSGCIWARCATSWSIVVQEDPR